jgi:carboxyl-terminal processing protease
MTVTKTELEEKENGNVTSRTRVGNLTGNKPVFILVNGGSASASEMFAGSLQDLGRAKLVGSKTFGKGISQLNIDLPFNTSMQVTFAKLYQPAGDCIHGVGMTPDYVVAPVARIDAPLTRALELAAPKAKP